MTPDDIAKALRRCPSFKLLTERNVEITIDQPRLALRYVRGGFWSWLIHLTVGSTASEIQVDSHFPMNRLDEQLEPHLQAALGLGPTSAASERRP